MGKQLPDQCRLGVHPRPRRQGSRQRALSIGGSHVASAGAMLGIRGDYPLD